MRYNARQIMARLATVVLLLMPVYVVSAQELEYNMELGGMAGGCSYMGDANYTNPLKNMALAGGLLARYNINPRMAVKTALTYGQIGGNTENVENFYPANPNGTESERLKHQFSGGLFDLSALYELHFLPYGYEQGYQGYSRIVPYIQAGFGLTYSSAGKAFTPNFPVGVGLKYKVARRLNLGLEWRMHFTFSDKLDNLEAPHGIKSSGMRNKDHFSVTMLTLTYDLAPKCPTCNKD